MEKSNDLKETPLTALHRELGARLVPFAGYHMPVQYPSGIIKEHQHTRAAAGLFDVSHMGQIRLRGAHPAAALERLVPVDLLDLAEGRQRYALFTNEGGGILDDLMVTNAGDHLFLVVNGACKDQDLAHLRQHLSADCTIEHLTEHALLALQGPQAAAQLPPGSAMTTARAAPHHSRMAEGVCSAANSTSGAAAKTSSCTWQTVCMVRQPSNPGPANRAQAASGGVRVARSSRRITAPMPNSAV